MDHDPPEVNHAPKPQPTDGRWFALALREHYGVLWSIARGLTGSASDADDILQDAVMIGWEKREAFEPGTNVLAWLASITRNVARNHQRKTARRDHASILDHDVPETATPTGDRVVDRATGEVRADQPAFDDRVMKALNQLTPTARACLLLRTIHGLEYRAIGEAMGLPKNTVLSHVHRARHAMRGLLDETDTAPQKGGRR